MKPSIPLSLLALTSVLLLAPSAFAQRLYTQRSDPPRMSGPPAPPGPARSTASPAPELKKPDLPSGGGIHSAIVQPGTGSSRLVIPARASGNLVEQGGAIPAVSSTDPLQSGLSRVVRPSELPAPRQPLSDVTIPRGTVRITIRAISAARAGSALEIDGRLAPIDRDLRSVADQFSFRSYRLLDVQTFDLDFHSIAQMELPGQRAIEVEPRQLAPDGRVQVHLELLGQHPEHAPRMRTDYSIPRGRTILVGGYRIDSNAPDGSTLLLAITQGE